jgi:hypothetical protein
MILGDKAITSLPPGSPPELLFPQQSFGFTGPIIGPDATPTPMLDITVVPEPGSGILAIAGRTSQASIVHRHRRR